MSKDTMDRCGMCNSPDLLDHCGSDEGKESHPTCTWKRCVRCGAYGDPKKDLWTGGKQ